MSNLLKVAFVLGAALASTPLLHADTTYSTISSWDGQSSISEWGAGSTPSYGQTFVAPTDTLLNSFTFYVQGGTETVDAAVYQWTGSLRGGSGDQGTTGASLFDSVFTIAGDGNMDAVTVNTGGVALMPGNDYVILLDALSGDDGVFGDTQYLHFAGDGGGGFAFTNNASPAGLWDDFGDFGDLAYSASFSAVSPTPEPNSLILLGTGVLGLAGAVRRRFGK